MVFQDFDSADFNGRDADPERQPEREAEGSGSSPSPDPVPPTDGLDASLPPNPDRQSQDQQSAPGTQGWKELLEALRGACADRSRGASGWEDVAEQVERLFRDGALRRSLEPVWLRLKTARAVICDRDAGYAAKAAAAEHVFAAAEAVVLEHAGDAAQALRTLAAQGRVIDVSSAQAARLPDFLVSFVQDPSEDFVRRAAAPFFELLRHLWRIEEQKIYDLCSRGDSPAARIEAGAALAKDTYYLWRQGRAILRLAAVLRHSADEGLARLEEFDDITPAEADRALLHVGGAIETLLRDAAPKLAASLRDLGPYWQKLAQTIGAVISGASPEAYTQIEHFQNQATEHMSGPETIRVIEADLGAPIGELYAEFDPKPFAVASIAQLHRAKIREGAGTRAVVVKVKGSRVAEELSWNTKVNRAFALWVKATSDLGDGNVLVDLVVEQAEALGETFAGELDFAAEARRQRRFRRLFALNPAVSIPQVHRGLCGDNVITMDDIGECEKIGFHIILDQAPAEAEKPPAAQAAEHPVEENIAGSAPPPSDPHVTVEVDGDAVGERVADTLAILKQLSAEVSRVGFRLGPQYAQLFRALGPPIGLILHFGREAYPLLHDRQPSEREAAQLNVVRKRAKTLKQIVADQFFYIGELHSDLQPANIHVDARNRLHLLDFGQTLQTKGLVRYPVSLTLSLLKGDAARAAKALTRMGTMKAGHDYRDLVPAIQTALDTLGVEKRSLLQVFRGVKADKDEADADADAEETAQPNEDENEAAAAPEPQAPAVAGDAEKKTAANSASRTGLRTLVSFALKYPFKRLMYLTLSGWDRVADALGY